MLAPYTGSCSIRTNNVVISNKTFNCQVDIYATGVRITNSRFVGGGAWGVYVRPGGSATIDRSTVQPSSGCNLDAGVTGSNMTITNSKILNFGDGFYVGGPNVLIQDNYAVMCSYGDAHSDGVQGYHAGTNVRIIHNHFDQRLPGAVTANIFWGDDSGTGLLVERNLFRGGGYTIRIHSASGHTVRDNVIDRSWLFGPVSSRCQGISWTNNRVANVSESQVLTNVAPQPCVGNS